MISLDIIDQPENETIYTTYLYAKSQATIAIIGLIFIKNLSFSHSLTLLLIYCSITIFYVLIHRVKPQKIRHKFLQFSSAFMILILFTVTILNLFFIHKNFLNDFLLKVFIICNYVVIFCFMRGIRFIVKKIYSSELEDFDSYYKYVFLILSATIVCLIQYYLFYWEVQIVKYVLLTAIIFVQSHFMISYCIFDIKNHEFIDYCLFCLTAVFSIPNIFLISCLCDYLQKENLIW
ncbi:hypothetical protein GVAV_002644 [Gurleya vavrai]